VPYPLEVLIKIAVAVVLGGAVGWQREARDRPAGLRTHVLVCIGAAVYTLASVSFSSERSDPSRVAAQVATGMGFLGAGTILRHGSIVRGLTTAASLWAVAGVGICVALGGRAMWVAVSRSRYAEIRVRLADARSRLADVQGIVEAGGARMDSVHVSEPDARGREEIQMWVRLPQGVDLGSLCDQVRRLEGFVSLRQEE
jgi:putative Mg2+ transporter-C (MgtC) family protein